MAPESHGSPRWGYACAALAAGGGASLALSLSRGHASHGRPAAHDAVGGCRHAALADRSASRCTVPDTSRRIKQAAAGAPGPPQMPAAMAQIRS